MSIKNDIEMVREELTSEEKFFEKSVITEKFVKKYKYLLIGAVVSVVVLVSANIAYDMNKESTALAANEALKELNTKPSDASALGRLQSLSPNLHDAYIYSQAIADQDLKALANLKNSQATIVSQLAEYESLKSVSDLEAYALNQEAIYKDLAHVQSAVLLMNEGKIEKAHAKLQLIGEMSSLNKIAQSLLHYGVK